MPCFHAVPAPAPGPGRTAAKGGASGRGRRGPAGRTGAERPSAGRASRACRGVLGRRRDGTDADDHGSTSAAAGLGARTPETTSASPSSNEREESGNEAADRGARRCRCRDPSNGKPDVFEAAITDVATPHLRRPRTSRQQLLVVEPVFDWEVVARPYDKISTRSNKCLNRASRAANFVATPEPRGSGQPDAGRARRAVHRITNGRPMAADR